MIFAIPFCLEDEDYDAESNFATAATQDEVHDKVVGLLRSSSAKFTVHEYMQAVCLERLKETEAGVKLYNLMEDRKEVG